MYSSQNSRIAAICITGLFDPLQIENEYGDSESAYGSGGKPYAMWAASMALSQNTGVPWIMCQQYDAPDPVVSFLISFLYCKLIGDVRKNVEAAIFLPKLMKL